MLLISPAKVQIFNSQAKTFTPIHLVMKSNEAK